MKSWVYLIETTYIYDYLFVVNGNAISDIDTEEKFKKYDKFPRYVNCMQHMFKWHRPFQLQDTKTNFAQFILWYCLIFQQIFHCSIFPLTIVFFKILFQVISFSDALYLLNLKLVICWFFFLTILKGFISLLLTVFVISHFLDYTGTLIRYTFIQVTLSYMLICFFFIFLIYFTFLVVFFYT